MVTSANSRSGLGYLEYRLARDGAALDRSTL